MNPIQIVAGIIAGIVGAAVWAAISFYGNLEVGYVAWGIGLLVGLAVAATGKNGALPGVAAVLITVVSILAGKYAALELAINKAGLDPSAVVAELRSEGDKAVVRSIADEIAEEKVIAGTALEWPAGMTLEDAMEPADYPPGIWDAADKQWKAMSPDEQAAKTESYFADVEANVAEGMNAMRQEGFLASFGMFDILFFGLAVVTAWGLANRGADGA